MKINVSINDDCISAMRKISDGSVDLVVADPPYWKVVGEKWDYQWRTEKEYVAWSMQWITDVSRALRIGGTSY